MPSNIQNITLALLASELSGSVANAAPAPDRDTLIGILRLSASHDVAHIVGAALEKRGWLTDERLKAAFEREGMTALYRYTRTWHTYDGICRVLEEEKIPYLPLKGALLRHIYPKPEMRTSCDIDILIPAQMRERAADALIAAFGFVRRAETYHDISLMLDGSVHLELHYNVCEDDGRTDPLLSRVWEYAHPQKDGGYLYEMTPAYFAFHTVAHMAHHFLEGGCGIRPVMDLWVLRHRGVFDEGGARALCEQCGIATFFDAALRLSAVWFSGEAHDELTALMQSFILDGGAFGTTENKAAAQSNTQRGSKLRYILGRIFMPKKQLARIYPILDKYPILLPICQVCRWLRTLRRGRGKKALSELAYTAGIPKEKEEAVGALMQRLGL